MTNQTKAVISFVLGMYLNLVSFGYFAKFNFVANRNAQMLGEQLQ